MLFITFQAKLGFVAKCSNYQKEHNLHVAYIQINIHIYLQFRKAVNLAPFVTEDK